MKTIIKNKDNYYKFLDTDPNFIDDIEHKRDKWVEEMEEAEPGNKIFSGQKSNSSFV